jgi:crossover junction endodeoxyribonuclease RuvC
VKRALGIDAAAARTGLVVLEAACASGRPVCVHQEVCAPRARGLARASATAGRMLALLQEHAPDLVVIEGYAMANRHSLVPLVELGTVLRYFLRQHGRPWLEPTPTQLKKFVLGAGHGTKEAVVLEVYRRWGFAAPCHDVADAYGLAAIGLAHLGALAGLTKAMGEVIARLQRR